MSSTCRPAAPSARRPGHDRSHPTGRAAALLLLALLIASAAGCGLGSDGDGEAGDAGAATSASAAPSSPPQRAVDGIGSGAPEQAPAGPSGDAAGDAAPPPDAARTPGRPGLARLAVGQRIAQTADVTVRVGKGRLDETLDAIALDAQRVGGYVVSSTVGDAGGRAPVEGTIVVRVPAPRFLAALRTVGRRGTVVSRSVGSEDVTQEYVDTQARLRHDRAVEGRLLTLLGRAAQVGEVLAVQDRLSTVQEEIEISKGRLEQLAGMTELSTIAVHLREPGGAAGPRPTDGWGVRAALRDAAHNAVDVVNGAIVALGALLPVLLVAALVAPIVLRVLRRRRGDGARAAGPPAADAG
jgi:hypothetical protein